MSSDYETKLPGLFALAVIVIVAGFALFNQGCATGKALKVEGTGYECSLDAFAGMDVGSVKVKATGYCGAKIPVEGVDLPGVLLGFYGTAYAVDVKAGETFYEANQRALAAVLAEQGSDAEGRMVVDYGGENPAN